MSFRNLNSIFAVNGFLQLFCPRGRACYAPIVTYKGRNPKQLFKLECKAK